MLVEQTSVRLLYLGRENCGESSCDCSLHMGIMFQYTDNPWMGKL